MPHPGYRHGAAQRIPTAHSRAEIFPTVQIRPEITKPQPILPAVAPLATRPTTSEPPRRCCCGNRSQLLGAKCKLWSDKKFKPLTFGTTVHTPDQLTNRVLLVTGPVSDGFWVVHCACPCQLGEAEQAVRRRAVQL